MKKLLSFLMAVVLTLSFSMFAFADDTTLSESVSSGSATVGFDNYGSTGGAFTITIPDVIEIADEGGDRTPYNVVASDVVIPYGSQLKLYCSYDNTVRNVRKNSLTLNYNLFAGADETSDTAIVSNDEILSIDAGNVSGDSVVVSAELTETSIYADTYEGTATFTAAVSNPNAGYTIQEINAMDNVYAIGETQPEYVIAVISNDGTTVTVSKNGPASDGIVGSSLNFINSSVTTVVVEDGIINLPNSMLENKSSVVSVSLPNSVTTIGENAFTNCSSLTSLTLGNSITSIGSWAFDGCGLVEDANNFENGVFYIGKYLIAAQKDYVGDITVKNGTELIAGSAFEMCDNITSITMPNSVRYIGSNAIVFCTALENIVFSDNIEVLPEYTVSDLFALESVTLPANLEEIGDGNFSGCDLLATVVIPSGTTTIGDMAFAYSGLTDVTIPASVTSMAEYAFDSCASLTVHCVQGSYADSWATSHGFTVAYVV